VQGDGRSERAAARGQLDQPRFNAQHDSTRTRNPGHQAASERINIETDRRVTKRSTLATLTALNSLFYTRIYTDFYHNSTKAPDTARLDDRTQGTQGTGPHDRTLGTWTFSWFTINSQPATNYCMLFLDCMTKGLTTSRAGCLA